MFTGIVEALGQIKAININSDGARVVVASGNLDLADVKLGDSIATNGIGFAPSTITSAAGMSPR